MRFLIIIIILALCIFSVGHFDIERFYKHIFLGNNEENTINSKNLVYRNGLGYEKSQRAPFTGKVTGSEHGYLKNGIWNGRYISYYNNGKIKYWGNYSGARKEGLWKSFRSNGQIIFEGNYKNGLKDGQWNFYHLFGSNLQECTNYKNGKKNGRHQSFWGDGNLRQKGSYKNGKPAGLWIFYDTDGITEKNKETY